MVCGYYARFLLLPSSTSIPAASAAAATNRPFPQGGLQFCERFKMSLSSDASAAAVLLVGV
jgi:hypothetical protein